MQQTGKPARRPLPDFSTNLQAFHAPELACFSCLLVTHCFHEYMSLQINNYPFRKEHTHTRTPYSLYLNLSTSTNSLNKHTVFPPAPNRASATSQARLTESFGEEASLRRWGSLGTGEVAKWHHPRGALGTRPPQLFWEKRRR